jgi:hypothetical protein
MSCDTYVLSSIRHLDSYCHHCAQTCSGGLSLISIKLQYYRHVMLYLHAPMHSEPHQHFWFSTCEYSNLDWI